MSKATRRWVVVLSVLGGLRVLLFAAAFPVFDFIDEGLHIDVVMKFASAGLPGPGGDYFHPDAARAIATQGADQLLPPYGSRLDRMSPAERDAAIDAQTKYLLGCRKAETFAPPVYYAVAAVWYRAGKVMGLKGVMLLYWLRFFSAPLYGAAIAVGCLTCATVYPDRPGVVIGLGLVLAALPQDILYVIDSDVMCPLAVAVTLYLVVRWLQSERPSLALAAGAGVAASCAMLVKYTNVGALALLGAAAIVALRRRKMKEAAALLLGAALPLGLWLARCQWSFGDWTAAKDKAAQLDWTPLTLAQSLQHPILRPAGMFDFLRYLCATFWRGELVWNSTMQRLLWADFFYWGISAVGVIAAVGWLIRPSVRGLMTRPLGAACFCVLTSSILFLAAISIHFDYGHCFFPSRGFPYFAAGRLLAGSIVPAMILLIGGIDELQGTQRRISVAVVAAVVIATVCMGSELYLCLSAQGMGAKSVFACPFNWYHLIAR